MYPGPALLVASVVAMAADGMSVGEVLLERPDLEVEDIREALRYAAEAIQGTGAPVAHERVGFLLDENLSPLMVGPLVDAGHNAVQCGTSACRACQTRPCWSRRSEGTGDLR